ncbi:Extracellular_nuclease [Hexamita inflata]|uniref:Extracellular nuclease n=2 Tax=Hexamita inflata TaxID=28002 RepID=A0AA86QBE3_9EUKA|nr:Extracellular nuclease [Hexamita inflata]CAI9928579.1 Extracellular nuclease [Hexamita inflata]CAI9955919.1 Extracellular nuclease [Hexamita inflata]CAI9955921.1 Extracellular nuclease [Hexamita inflata]
MLFSLVTSELFPGLYGQDLRKALKVYADKGAKSLGYDRARQEMYGYVYNDPKDQAVYCVYTGFRMPCKYDSMNTKCNSAGDLNCEHTVPQSFFNKAEPMKSDMHHLRGAWDTANSGRWHYPFGTLAEESKIVWYGNNKKKVTTKPSDPENWSTCDGMGYGSASDEGMFEPRDDFKGNLARATAYFYIRYPTQAGPITRLWPNIDDMIDWDQNYANTDLQQAQYLRVVEVQGNKNPFQEEQGLTARAFCDLSVYYPCSHFQ